MPGSSGAADSTRSISPRSSSRPSASVSEHLAAMSVPARIMDGANSESSRSGAPYQTTIGLGVVDSGANRLSTGIKSRSGQYPVITTRPRTVAVSAIRFSSSVAWPTTRRVKSIRVRGARASATVSSDFPSRWYTGGLERLRGTRGCACFESTASGCRPLVSKRRRNCGSSDDVNTALHVTSKMGAAASECTDRSNRSDSQAMSSSVIRRSSADCHPEVQSAQFRRSRRARSIGSWERSMLWPANSTSGRLSRMVSAMIAAGSRDADGIAHTSSSDVLR